MKKYHIAQIFDRKRKSEDNISFRNIEYLNDCKPIGFSLSRVKIDATPSFKLVRDYSDAKMHLEQMTKWTIFKQNRKTVIEKYLV